MIRDWKLLSVYACKEKEGGGDAGFDKVKKSSIAHNWLIQVLKKHYFYASAFSREFLKLHLQPFVYEKKSISVEYIIMVHYRIMALCDQTQILCLAYVKEKKTFSDYDGK